MNFDAYFFLFLVCVIVLILLCCVERRSCMCAAAMANDDYTYIQAVGLHVFSSSMLSPTLSTSRCKRNK